MVRRLGPPIFRPAPTLGGQIGKFNEIQAGRFNRYLQRLLGIKGGAPMPSLASDLQAVLLLFDGIENHYLQGWNRFYIQLGITGIAGQLSVAQIRNPTGNNVIAVLERATFSSTAAADQGALIQNRNPTGGDQPTIATASARNMDPRGNPQPSTVVSHDNGGSVVAVTGGANYIKIPQVTANQTYDLLPPGEDILFLAGDNVQVANNVAATAMQVTLVWRERFWEDSERT